MKDDRVDLWSLDEVHFQQHGSACRMWIPPDVKDPVLLHHPTRKSVGYFGAVRLRDGKFVWAREAGRFDATSFWSFLQRLRQRACHANRRVIVILDNAGFHHAALHAEWRRLCQRRFRVDFLPPYSPDLNPIERIWKLVRRLRLHNRYFRTLDEVTLTVDQQFDSWGHSSSILRRLCAII